MAEKHLSEVEQLRLANAELSALNEIVSAINASLSVDKITEIILDKSLKHFGASQGAIFLHQFEILKTLVRRIGTFREEMPIHFNMNLTGWMIKHKRPLVVNSPERESPLPRLDFESLGIKSLLASPLLTRNGMIGVIALFNKEGNEGFTIRDSRFLELLASQCAHVIEAARLSEEEKRLIAIRKELETARLIQQSFLPRSFKDEATLYGFNRQAREVGGDFYNAIWLDDDRVFVPVGDVAGKGVPAALFMSNAVAVVRAHLSNPAAFSVASSATNLNQVLCQFNKPGEFITAFLSILDLRRGTFEYVNAGHYPPIIVRNGQLVVYDHIADVPLGVLAGNQYRATTLALQPDSTVCIYTDGVTEALNESGEDYGERRLVSFLRRVSSEPARTICDKLLEDLNQFCGSAEQSDDITAVVLKT